jgi:hypothetical protein
MGRVRKKAQKGKDVKPVMPDEFGFCIPQYDVVQGVKDDKKVKPKDVFEGYTEKKKGKQGKKNINNNKKYTYKKKKK